MTPSCLKRNKARQWICLGSEYRDTTALPRLLMCGLCAGVKIITQQVQPSKILPKPSAALSSSSSSPIMVVSSNGAIMTTKLVTQPTGEWGRGDQKLHICSRKGEIACNLKVVFVTRVKLLLVMRPVTLCHSDLIIEYLNGVKYLTGNVGA